MWSNSFLFRRWERFPPERIQECRKSRCGSAISGDIRTSDGECDFGLTSSASGRSRSLLGRRRCFLSFFLMCVLLAIGFVGCWDDFGMDGTILLNHLSESRAIFFARYSMRKQHTLENPGKLDTSRSVRTNPHEVNRDLTT